MTLTNYVYVLFLQGMYVVFWVYFGDSEHCAVCMCLYYTYMHNYTSFTLSWHVYKNLRQEQEIRAWDLYPLKAVKSFVASNVTMPGEVPYPS